MRYLPLIGPITLLVLWFIIFSLGIVSPLIIPNPSDVFLSLVNEFFGSENILLHIFLTVYRTIFSFILACVIGIPIGLLMGYTIHIYKAFEFLVDFFRSIPPIALFPLFMLFLGIGELSKLGVPFYGCVLVIIINSMYGVVNSSDLRRLLGKVYGFKRKQIFIKIVFPDALPQIFVGLRTAISLALVLTIVVEMFIGSENGLGKKIYDYHLLFDTPEMYAAIIITGIIGFTLNKGFIKLEQKIVHWKGK